MPPSRAHAAADSTDADAEAAMTPNNHTTTHTRDTNSSCATHDRATIRTASNGAAAEAADRGNQQSAATARCWFDRYFAWLDRGKRALLVLWIVVGAVGAGVGPGFFKYTSASGGAVAGTLVYEANHQYAAHFPDAAATTSLIVLIQRSAPDAAAAAAAAATSPSDPAQLQPADDGTVLTNVTASWTTQLLAAAEAYPTAGTFRGLSSYFTLAPTRLAALADSFVSADRTVTMVSISYAAKADFDAFTRYFRRLIARGLTFPADAPPSVRSQYSARITGMDLLFDDTVTESEKDFIRMDGIVLPMALMVLALYLRNLRLMLIPLLSVALTLLAAFAFMHPLARWAMAVASFAPSIMVSMAIAMSIDYSLFLLSRYREETLREMSREEEAEAAKKRREQTQQSGSASSFDAKSDASSFRCSNYRAVHSTLRTAGHVVLVSGGTLLLTFLGLLFFPLPFLQSIGVGCAATLFFCLLVNLSLTPVLLLLFPGFFGQFKLLPDCVGRRLSHRWRQRIEGADNMRWQRMQARRQAASAATLAAELSSTAPDVIDTSGGIRMDRLDGDIANGGVLAVESTSLDQQLLGLPFPSDSPEADAVSPEEELASKRAQQESSFWFRSASFTTTTRNSWLLLLCVAALTLPVAYFSVELRPSSDVGLIFPRNSDALAAFEGMQTKFPPGRIDPFRALCTTTAEGGGVWTADFFHTQQRLVATMIDRGLVANSSASGIAFVNGAPLPFELAIAAFDSASPLYDQPSAWAYRALVSSATSADRTATILTVETDFNPDGDEAANWVDQVRALLAEFESGGQGRAHDQMQGKADSNLAAVAADPDPNSALDSAPSPTPSPAPSFRWYLTGGATYAVDSSRKVNSLFPAQVAVTASLLFLLVALLFRSIIVPLRLVLTIGLSIAFVYGLAVLVFQRGWADWIAPGFRGGTRSVYWMETVMTFSIMTGLGLDYDVFLFSRVHEYRRLGYTTRGAVIKAVAQSGSIITVAGVVMALAFGGLMASGSMVLVQFGFLLCFAVLIDTFIIRTLLVPALLHLAGRANWWPGSYPPERFTEADFVDLNDVRDLVDAAAGGPAEFGNVNDRGAKASSRHRDAEGQPASGVFHALQIDVATDTSAPSPSSRSASDWTSQHDYLKMNLSTPSHRL